MNPSCQPAMFVAAFNNEDPGVAQVGQRYFGLLPDIVGATLGGLGVESVAGLAALIPDNVAYGAEECLQRCGITRGNQPTSQQQPRVSANAFPSGISTVLPAGFVTAAAAPAPSGSASSYSASSYSASAPAETASAAATPYSSAAAASTYSAAAESTYSAAASTYSSAAAESTYSASAAAESTYSAAAPTYTSPAAEPVAAPAATGPAAPAESEPARPSGGEPSGSYGGSSSGPDYGNGGSDDGITIIIEGDGYTNVGSEGSSSSSSSW